MAYTIKKINVIGGSKSAYRPSVVANDRTTNMLIVPVDEQTAYLESFAGSTLAVALSGLDRSSFRIDNDNLLVVRSGTLYLIDNTLTATSKGTILGSNRCIFDRDLSVVIITTGATGYSYNISTGVITEITDVDYEPANSVTYLNNQMIYDGDDGRFQVSDVGAPSTINSLNYATAYAKASEVQRTYAFDQTLYVFTNESIEPWYNSGSGNPPFERVSNVTVGVGLGAIHSVANSVQSMYFLGTDKKVHKIRQYNPEVVSTPTIQREISEFSDISDAIGSVFEFQGCTYYYLVFRSANKSYLYCETTNTWVNLESDSVGTCFNANSFISFNDNLYYSHFSGNIYKVDSDVYTLEGNSYYRCRQLSTVDNTQLGLSGYRILLEKVILDCDLGNGLLTGQGEDPKVSFFFSADGGKSWSQEYQADLRRLGDTVGSCECTAFFSFYSLLIRISTTEPVYFNIKNISISIKKSGR
jgi:hypothetical protein